MRGKRAKARQQKAQQVERLTALQCRLCPHPHVSHRNGRHVKTFNEATGCSDCDALWELIAAPGVTAMHDFDKSLRSLNLILGSTSADILREYAEDFDRAKS